ncbi:MAG: hypothetical protein MI807_00925 [Verrucomicrobiales bacterium]|nr:hypothetical protein [Verrucomicrobiales bacterium]
METAPIRVGPANLSAIGLWIAIAIAVPLVILGQAAYAESSESANDSPHNFPVGECTWGADLLTYYWSDWDLEFFQNWNRHAMNWPLYLLNGISVNQPGYGDIMILEPHSSNGYYGHVAWTAGSWYDDRYNGYWILAVHTNWGPGEELFTHDGARFRASWFFFHPTWWPGEVWCWDNEKMYPLDSFISKAW